MISNLILIWILAACSVVNGAQRKFPENFEFGAATAAYQIEGGWNEDGKGESIWDRYAHTRTNEIVDGKTGDVACDSFHQYKTDIQMLKTLGSQYYRFSVSWTRILPTGLTNNINQLGIDYYNKVIDEVIANGITPLITIYHWDLPQPLQDLGGFANTKIVDYFEDYARLLFKLYGDKVKDWITFNEPHVFCGYFYGSDMGAPAVNISGVADYLCGHTVLLSHARVYHMYAKEFKKTQKGKITLSLNARWFEPGDDSEETILAAERGIQFEVGWFGHPIFSKEGDYPEEMKKAIAEKSKEQGLSTSRLPSFTPEEVQYIKGTADYFGVNHYTSILIKANNGKEKYLAPSFTDDSNIYTYFDKSWKTAQSPWLKVVPWGLFKLMKWITEKYDSPDIAIFENGYSDSGGLINDVERIDYYRGYLNAALDAIEAGCHIIRYTAWSLMDNMEWKFGYTQHFGLFMVDYSTPNKTRTAKDSVRFFKKLTETKMIPED